MTTDLRHALRSLRRCPGFAAAAILTLGLGVGASTAVFTLLKRVVLDPLPYPESGRLVRLKLLLAAMGLYGTISYLVTRRTNGIGIRVALGARAHEIERLVVVGSLRLAMLGLGIGVVVSLAITRVLGSLLFGVTPTDPVSYLAASVLLSAVALLAGWLPARRAARVDPMEALRYE